ncbi:tRNA dihydrouridine(20/20a) synthase DusA [Hwanghaeella sp. LZ110]|jgi:tRNA-dihydrouridine synthase A|uniref:tRNA dihydrouridine(20/20a) synthase DusA n=1 Tax=Hwanghaeella sp. LZ110 TaxID=3402810 RepID=UPI003B66BB40
MKTKPTINSNSRAIDRRLSVAPMMDWTDRFDRYFLRLITRHSLLYTEMITTGALLHGDAQRFLAFDGAEHPVACQLGGSSPHDLAKAARMVEGAGYDEVNLNVGCPSDRVQNGQFGACLMADPHLVRDCVAAMRDVVSIPVTVKCRIGINGRDSYQDLTNFIDTVRQGGCDTFIVHARIAILEGLSPKQNREIPPLQYDVVHQVKRDFPSLSISLNGGIQSLDDAVVHLSDLDGVMIGRAAYQDPYCLAQADAVIFGDAPGQQKSRHDIVRLMLPYIEAQCRDGVALHHITRHILGLFNGLPGARRWRRFLSENAYGTNAGPEIVEQAMALVPEQDDAGLRA